MNNFESHSLYLSNDLITNFKPKIAKKFNKIDLFKIKKEQIFCKNFFLFLLLLKYKNKTNNVFKKSTIFIKPYKKKIFTVLRSPYRHKLTRHQLVLNRYHIRSFIEIDFFNIKLHNFNSLIKIFNFTKKLNGWFESNIIYNHRYKFSFKFVYKNNFILKNFNKNSSNKKKFELKKL